jgi:hypothetical protein
MKKIWNNLIMELDKKTNPDAPLVTTRMLQFLLLRFLLGILLFMVIDRFIVEITLLKYVLIELLFDAARFVIKIVRGK